MRDFTNTQDLPYNTHGKESLLGLFEGASDTVKPGLEFLAEFAKNVSSRQEPPALPEDSSEAVGLYLPAHHYQRDDPANPGNSPPDTIVAANLVYHFLRMLRRDSRVIRGDRPLPTNLRTLIVPSALLTEGEIAQLSAWVGGGGRLLWHGFDQTACETSEGAKLPGVSCAGTGLPASGNLSLRFGGEEWRMKLGWRASHQGNHTARGARMSKTSAARVWTASSDGGSVAAAVLSRHGKGAVLAVALPVESAIEPLAARPSRDRWVGWYGSALACVEEGRCDAGGSPNIDATWQAAADDAEPTAELQTTKLPSSSAKLRRVGIYSCTHSLGLSAQLGGGHGCSPGDAAPAAKAAAAVRSHGLLTSNLSSPLAGDALAGLDAIVIPSQHWLTITDQEVISRFASAGGCVIRHGIDTSTFSAVGWDTIGAAAADFRSPLPSTFTAMGRAWTMASFLGAGSVHVQLAVSDPQRPSWGTATELAADGRGIGALYTNKPGRGTAITATPAVDSALEGRDLAEWYAGVLGLCE